MLRFLMAVVAVLFFWSGLAPADQRAGSFFERSPKMGEEKKEAPEFLERATQATTRPVTVPLDEFLQKRDLYCHRDDSELEEPALRSLMDSLVVEGLHDPIPFFRDSDGKPVPTGGHRRLTSMGILADRNTPGFSNKMLVPAIEILNASPQDLLCRSVSDNCNRDDHTLAARIRIAKRMHEGGVESTRAAHAMKYSTKQYLRDLRIAKSDWMFGMVDKEQIGHTQASDLLEAAEKAKRMSDLELYLTIWVDEKAKEIRQRASLAGKGKAAKEKKVSSELSTTLSNHWIQLLKDGAELDDELPIEPEVVVAGIDADSNKVVFSEVEFDLLKTPLKDLAKMVDQIGGVRKVVISYLKSRFAVEGALGPQDVARKESQRDSLDSLRAEGLGELADQLSGLMDDDSSADDAKDGK